ncbi:PKD domain-containing protein, partial [Bacteroidota bacterium]
EQTDIVLTGVYNSSVAWGDYDNDGYLDILLTGSYMSKIFHNNGDNSFTEKTAIELPGVSSGSVAWGDYDNDGDLDILLTGSSMSKIFNNDQQIFNSPPIAPTDITTILSGSSMIFSWDKATDQETPQLGLSYNLRIGTSPGAGDILSPMSLQDGKRSIVYFGNCGNNTSLTIDISDHTPFPEDIYYCVQAIDNGFLASGWSVEKSEVLVFISDFSLATGCQKRKIQFEDKSYSDDYPISSYKWEFIEGSDTTTSVLQNPFHIFQTAGTHQVKLTITNSNEQIAFVSRSVNVLQSPQVDFYADIACQGSKTSFLNTSNINSTNISYWGWDFGDGTTSALENPDEHGYLNTGNYSAELIAVADNGCADTIQKTVTVAEYPAKTVSIDGSLQFCDGDSTVLNAVYNDLYNYQWKLGGADIFGADSCKYTVIETGSYSVRIENSLGNCMSSSDEISITVASSPSAPTIISSGLLAFCQNDSAILYVTDNPDYSYQWKYNDGAIGTDSSVFIVRNSGTYSLELSNSNGCSVTSNNQVDITVHPLPVSPTINLSGPTSFCEGNNVELSVTADPAYSYQWKNSSGNITGQTDTIYSATTSEGYYLEVTSADGCIVETGPKAVVVNPIPAQATISASSALDFCKGDSLVLSVPFIADYNYQWKQSGGGVGENSNSLTVKTSGTYSVDVTNISACVVSSFNQIEVNVRELPDLPTVDLSGPTTFCEGNNVELSVTANPAYTYQWKNSAGNITGQTATTYTATTSEGYYLEVRSADGCIVETSPKAVIVKPIPAQPTISASSALDFCNGDSVVLSVTDNPEYSYQWIINSGAIGIDSSIFIGKNTGTYSLEVTNTTNGCNALSTNQLDVIVYSLPILPSVNKSGPTTFCEGNEVELSVISNPAYTYRWKNSFGNISDQTGTTLIASTSEDYYLEVSSAEGCIVETMPTSVTVNPNPFAPTISASGPVTFCAGDNVELSVPEDAIAIYKWIKNDEATGINQNTLTVNSTGVYTLEVSNASGCKTMATNTVNISVLQNPEMPQVNTSGQTVFCEGKSILFSTAHNPELSYQWKDGDLNLSGANSSEYTASVSGKYKLEVSNSDRCFVQTPEISVTVNPVPDVPTISYSDPETFCQGDSLVLSVAEDPLITYRWIKGVETVVGNTTSYTARATGNYKLEARSSLGCSSFSTDSVIVTVNPSPPIPALSVDGGNDFCAGDSSLLSVSDNENLRYQWINESTNIANENTSNFYASTSGRYKVEIENSYGCTNQSLYEDINVTPAPLKPTITYSGDLDICEGERVLLNAVSNSTDAHAWYHDEKSVGTNSTSLLVEESGTYYLKVTNNDQCYEYSENQVSIIV